MNFSTHNNTLCRQLEDIVHRGHYVSDSLAGEIQHTPKQKQLFVLQFVFNAQRHERFQLGFAICHPLVVRSKQIVEKLRLLSSSRAKTET